VTTYRNAAELAFQRIIELVGSDNKVFDTGNGYWHQANTLDACLEHLVMTQQKDNYGLLKNAIKYVFDPRMIDSVTKKPVPPSDWAKWSYDGNGPWADDYGWWGNALMRAYEHRTVLGYDDNFAASILALAINCFNGLSGTWDSSEAVPGVSGGAWNHYNPNWALTGRNNVTNLVLWLLAQELTVQSDKDHKEPYLDRMNSEALFFSTADQVGVLKNSKNLLLERLKGMSNGATFKVSNEPWYWIGDQGLYMRACLQNGRAGGIDYSTAAIAIEKDIRSMRDNDGVLHDNKCPNSDFNDDYATGKGAVMRSYRYWLSSLYPGSQPADFSQFILANASNVWLNRPWQTKSGGEQYQFSSNWNPKGKPYSADPYSGEPEFPNDALGVAPSKFSLLVCQVAGLEALNAVFTLGDKILDQEISKQAVSVMV